MKPLAKQDLYELLEVPRDAREDEIVRAWERAEALYGPGSLATYTLVSPEEAAILARRLEEALAVLLDPESRRSYDASLARGEGSEGPAAGPGGVGATADRARAAPGATSSRQAPVAPAPGPGAEGAEDAAASPVGPLLLTRVVPQPQPQAQGARPHPPGQGARPPAQGAQPLAQAPPGQPPPLPPRTPLPGPPPPSRRSFPSGPPVAIAVAAAQAPEPSSARRVAFVDEGADVTGDFLRRAREARGISAEAMCARTRIPRHHLASLEAEQRDRLPAPVYLRGYLMAIARELRLDGQKVARSYLQQLASAADSPRPPGKGR